MKRRNDDKTNIQPELSITTGGIMRKIKFIINRIKKMDFKALFGVVRSIHKKTGKCRIVLFFDIIHCGLKYGAGYKDYELYEFYNLTSAQRATYVVRTTNNLVIAHCNDRNYYHCLNDKIEFNKTYSEFIKRDWLDMRSASKEDFIRFAENKTAFIVKPIDACCGVGVQKITLDSTKSIDEIYDSIKSTEGAELVEDYVVQHHTMSELYPYSVNTCRIVTLLKNNDVTIVFAAIRIGNHGKVVDNINNGGLFAPLDIATGAVTFIGCDKDSNTYEAHPMTGCPIKGFKVPYWEEALEMCKKAALITPQIRYCGWDVAITEDGPIFIECNHMPGYDIMQLPAHTPSKIGMLPKFRELLSDEMKL